MFNGTTIDDLLAVVEKVEASAETKSMLRKQLEQAPLFFLAAYEPVVRDRAVIGVA